MPAARFAREERPGMTREVPLLLPMASLFWAGTVSGSLALPLPGSQVCVPRDPSLPSSLREGFESLISACHALSPALTSSSALSRVAHGTGIPLWLQVFPSPSAPAAFGSRFGARFPSFQRPVLFQTPPVLWMLHLRGAWTRVSHKILLVTEGKTAPSWPSPGIPFCSVSGGLSYFHDGVSLPSPSTLLCVLKSASQAKPSPQREASRCEELLVESGGAWQPGSVAASSFPTGSSCGKTKCRTLSSEPTGRQRDLAAPSGHLDHALCQPVSCRRLSSGKAARKALGTCCSGPGAGGKCC